MYDQILQKIGTNQSGLETLLVIGGIVILFGAVIYLFWHWILIGAGLFIMLAIFSHHSRIEKVDEKPTVQKEVIIQPSPPQDPEKTSYMEDCVSLTSKPDLCEEHWAERNDLATEVAEATPQVIEQIPEKQGIDFDHPVVKTIQTIGLFTTGAGIIHKILH